MTICASEFMDVSPVNKPTFDSPYFKTNIIEIIGEMSKDYSNLNLKY